MKRGSVPFLPPVNPWFVRMAGTVISARMQKLIIPFLLIFSFSVVAAQPPSVAFGLGLETNMNARNGYALGSMVKIDGEIGKQFALGVCLGLSRDLSRFVTIEPAAFFRWYMPVLRSSGGGLFLQGDAGMSIIKDNSEMRYSFMGGGTVGLRYAFRSGSYYIEPYVKGGYPFLWGIGIVTGCRF
ncbi:MAG: hypothetical protein LBR47_07185 [Spirochaetaceae bacterium]|nr:hypothetical protein [Spirochaetaceae bacterium]